MRSVLLRLPLFLPLLALCAPAQTPGQRPPPHLGFVYPAGARQGTTVTVTLGGQNLAGPAEVIFSPRAIRGRIVEFRRPVTQAEYNAVRDQHQLLLDKRAASLGKPNAEGVVAKVRPAFTPADEARLAELKAKLAHRPNRQANPAIAECVVIEVEVPAQLGPGDYEVRLCAAAGLSNPMVFCVGQLPEISDPVVTASMPTPELARLGALGGGAARSRPARDVTLPAIVNGQVLQGEVDRWRFAGRKGQLVTVAVSARALVPFLADAVPGWFQPTLALHDASGRELGYADDYRFNPDPVLAYQLPQDGDYTVAIKDSIFRGREDFVYRIAIGELPFITSLHPLGAAPAPRSTFELAGWNLPNPLLSVDTTGRGRGTFLFAVRKDGQLSNSARVALDPEPPVGETEPNDRREDAQPLAAAGLVDGRIGRAGDEDFFRFDGQAGQAVVAEITARRLASPLDSTLELTDAAGRRIAFNDDHDEKHGSLNTHHADSYLRVKLPADGTYFLRVADAQRAGGPEYSYRLRFGAPQPDFELRVVPASINARAGTHVPLTVYALRRDGFDGEIVLGLKDAPRAFALSGARIPAGQDKVTVTFIAGVATTEGPIPVQLGGRAVIDGQNVSHPAVAAEDMMQAFFYRHLVPARELLAHVTGRATSFARLQSTPPLRLGPGAATARAQFVVPNARGPVRVELAGAPEGLAVTRAELTREVLDVTLGFDAAKLKAAVAGNLILHVYGDGAATPAKKNAKANPRGFIATLPALPFVFEPAVPPGSLARN
jgi:hypothetical protein